MNRRMMRKPPEPAKQKPARKPAVGLVNHAGEVAIIAERTSNLTGKRSIKIRVTGGDYAGRTFIAEDFRIFRDEPELKNNHIDGAKVLAEVCDGRVKSLKGENLDIRVPMPFDGFSPMRSEGPMR